MPTPIKKTTGFVSKPTQTPQRPVRPDSPVQTGVIAKSVSGKTVKKKVANGKP